MYVLHLPRQDTEVIPTQCQYLLNWLLHQGSDDSSPGFKKISNFFKWSIRVHKPPCKHPAVTVHSQRWRLESRLSSKLRFAFWLQYNSLPSGVFWMLELFPVAPEATPNQFNVSNTPVTNNFVVMTTSMI